jgi:hypothetical protein
LGGKKTASTRSGKTPREWNAELREQSDRMAVAIQGMRAQVPMNLVPNLRGGPSAQVADLFEDDDRPARPGDQRRGGKPGQSAAHNDQIGMRKGGLPDVHYRISHVGKTECQLTRQISL